MKWAETIRLRSTPNRRRTALEMLKQEMPNVSTVPLLIHAEVYLHATIESDLCLAMNFEGALHSERPHDLTLKLTSALEEYGLVEHVLWIAHDEQAHPIK